MFSARYELNLNLIQINVSPRIKVLFLDSA